MSTRTVILAALLVFLFTQASSCGTPGNPSDPFGYYPTLTPAPPTATVEPTPAQATVPLYGFVPLDPGPEFFSYMEQVAKVDYSPDVVDPLTDPVPDVPGYGRVFSPDRYTQVLQGMPGGDLIIAFCTSLVSDISNPISSEDQCYQTPDGGFGIVQCVSGYTLQLDSQNAQTDFGIANVYLGQMPDGQTYAMEIPPENVPEQGDNSIYLVEGNAFIGVASSSYKDVVLGVFQDGHLTQNLISMEESGVAPIPIGEPVGEYTLSGQP